MSHRGLFDDRNDSTCPFNRCILPHIHSKYVWKRIATEIRWQYEVHAYDHECCCLFDNVIVSVVCTFVSLGVFFLSWCRLPIDRVLSINEWMDVNSGIAQAQELHQKEKECMEGDKMRGKSVAPSRRPFTK